MLLEDSAKEEIHAIERNERIHIVAFFFPLLEFDTNLFPLVHSVLPIPVVIITGGVKHENYLIKYSSDQSHPHYNKIKA